MNEESKKGPARALRAGGAALAALLGVAIALPAAAGPEQGSIARGGRLYDKWYKVIDADAPSQSHALYPKDKKYAKKPKANWRCKECHGWDYKGKDGAYAKGKHSTGIPGIRAAAGRSPGDIAKMLAGAPHGYGDKMGKADLMDLGLFVSKGQVDMDAYVDAGTKKARGDAARGGEYYATLCAQCHGDRGTKIDEMPALGKLTNDNPWEALHKVLNGQPGEKMPALRALDPQVAADIISYAQTLPKEK